MLPSHTSVPSLKMGLSVPVTSCLHIKTTSISYATEKNFSLCVLSDWFILYTDLYYVFELCNFVLYLYIVCIKKQHHVHLGSRKSIFRQESGAEMQQACGGHHSWVNGGNISVQWGLLGALKFYKIPFFSVGVIKWHHWMKELNHF